MFVDTRLHLTDIQELIKLVRVVDQLDIPEHVVVARDIRTTANTLAASIPLALASLIDAGRTQAGDPVVLMGFGAGLTYAGQVVRVP